MPQIFPGEVHVLRVDLLRRLDAVHELRVVLVLVPELPGPLDRHGHVDRLLDRHAAAVAHALLRSRRRPPLLDGLSFSSSPASFARADAFFAFLTRLAGATISLSFIASLPFAFYFLASRSMCAPRCHPTLGRRGRSRPAPPSSGRFSRSLPDCAARVTRRRAPPSSGFLLEAQPLGLARPRRSRCRAASAAQASSASRTSLTVIRPSAPLPSTSSRSTPSSSSPSSARPAWRCASRRAAAGDARRAPCTLRAAAIPSSLASSEAADPISFATVFATTFAICRRRRACRRCLAAACGRRLPLAAARRWPPP